MQHVVEHLASGVCPSGIYADQPLAQDLSVPPCFQHAIIATTTSGIPTMRPILSPKSKPLPPDPLDVPFGLDLLDITASVELDDVTASV